MARYEALGEREHSVRVRALGTTERRGSLVFRINLYPTSCAQNIRGLTRSQHWDAGGTV